MIRKIHTIRFRGHLTLKMGIIRRNPIGELVHHPFLTNTVQKCPLYQNCCDVQCVASEYQLIWEIIVDSDDERKLCKGFHKMCHLYCKKLIFVIPFLFQMKGLHENNIQRKHKCATFFALISILKVYKIKVLMVVKQRICSSQQYSLQRQVC